MSAAPPWWTVLDVEPSATLAECHRALRRLQHAVHPDRRPGDRAAEERFKLLRAAYAEAEQQHKATLAVPTERRDVPGVDLAAELDLPLLVALRGGRHEQLVDRGPQPAVLVTLVVPPGTRPGRVLRIAGKGRPGSPPGDLLVTIRGLLPHPRWRVEGVDILGPMPLRLDEVFTGGHFDLEDAPWRAVRVVVPARTLAPVRVAGHGWRTPGQPPGDLVLEPVLIWPRYDPYLAAILKSASYSAP